MQAAHDGAQCSHCTLSRIHCSGRIPGQQRNYEGSILPGANLEVAESDCGGAGLESKERYAMRDSTKEAALAPGTSLQGQC